MSVTEIKNAVSRMTYEQFAAWFALAAVALALLTGATAVAAGLGSVLAAAPIFERESPGYAVTGIVATSDGRTYAGSVYTTGGKPLRIFDRGTSEYVDFALTDAAAIEVAVEEEHEEPYWYWKESGSDEKVYTGNTYPWRKYLTTVVFVGGRHITGDLDGLIYVEAPSPAADAPGQSTDTRETGAESTDTQETGPRKYRFLLHKRDKGQEGQKPADMVYVTAVKVAVERRESQR